MTHVSDAMFPVIGEARDRVELGRRLLSLGIEQADLELEPDLSIAPAEAALTADLAIPFPPGLAPVPQPPPTPAAPGDPLPHADVLVVTWTVAEQNALADVFTPGYARLRWPRYNRNFATDYADDIRRGAPAAASQRLGSWMLTTIGNESVLCFKSELHLNQDGKATGDGTATLPVRKMFHQIIDEVGPGLVITVGTAGGAFDEHELGDIVVTRGAQFRLQREFANEDFKSQAYKSDWTVPTTHFDTAQGLMSAFASNLQEPAFGPPTKRYPWPGGVIQLDPPTPDIKLDGRDMPAFHPMLTVDYYEFGTSTNRLDNLGSGVEMGDAVLGMVCGERQAAPNWLVIRNVSDPVINGDLPTGRGSLDMQSHWATWYYEAFGYWTSVMSALTTWAVIAGLN